ncbi:MAG: phytoene/squalene synthase family protein [Rhodospirillales bacterium]|nr:phytoene/squalene synthase family protein [Rhodospirillales bacterium]
MAPQLSPVGALARAADYDRYLSAVFAPAPRREALFALIAFNHEIARIPEAVSEPMLGRIRLQWWREVLDSVYAGEPTRRHEVAVPLADAIHARGLDRAPFDALLNAREEDLEPEGLADLVALERYAAATGGSLAELMVRACGADSGPALEAGRQIGTAWALIGTLRAAPHAAAQGRVTLPADLLSKAGIAAEDLRAGPGFERFAVVAEPAAGRAVELLAAARQARHALARKGLGVLLIARLADLYLAQLRRAAWDPRDPRVTCGPLRKQTAMLIGFVLSRY